MIFIIASQFATWFIISIGLFVLCHSDNNNGGECNSNSSLLIARALFQNKKHNTPFYCQINHYTIFLHILLLYLLLWITFHWFVMLEIHLRPSLVVTTLALFTQQHNWHSFLRFRVNNAINAKHFILFEHRKYTHYITHKVLLFYFHHRYTCSLLVRWKRMVLCCLGMSLRSHFIVGKYLI